MARRARKDLDVIQEKRAKVVELRARGQTWEVIAAATGYSNASAASKAWHAAVKQRPDMAVDQVREQEKTRLEYLFGKTAEQVESPGPRVSAIGKVALFPAGHPKAGEIVEDESVRARAIDNYRKLSESYRKLCGADAAPAAPPLDDELLIRMAEVRVLQRQMAAQAPVPPLRALPVDYAVMSPQEQMEAELARRRTQHREHQAAIAAVPADVVDAEVVE